MKARKRVSIDHPIIVSSEDLENLDNFLRENFSSITYEAECVDGTIFEPENLSGLLEYENPGFRKLERVNIEAQKLLSRKNLNNLDDEQEATPIKDYSNVQISLGKDVSGFFSISTGSIYLNFSDARQQFVIEDEILKRIKAMRPWYSLLAKISFTWLIMGGLSVLIVLAIIILTLVYATGMWSPPSNTNNSGVSSIFTLGYGILLFLFASLLDRIRVYFLPNYFFCIGRQKKEYEKRLGMGKLILQILLVGIILGIAVNLISSSIWSKVSQ